MYKTDTINEAKVIKNDNYGYCKIGRAITVKRAKEKSPIFFYI